MFAGWLRTLALMAHDRKATLDAPAVSSSSLAIVARLSTYPARSGLANSVSSQMKNGIALGLLRRGERLPSEEELSRLFGVSVLTLRQALERLRHENLVQTKSGRRGGSFISSGKSDLSVITKKTLELVSLNHVSSLGLGTAVLFAETARAAALCLDDFDRKSLNEYFGKLSSSKTALEQRRAATLLVIGIASAARNERLLSSIIPMIGQLHLMAGPHTELLAPHVIDSARHVVRAIVRSEPEVAFDSGHRMIRETTEIALTNKLALNAPKDATEEETNAKLLSQFNHLLQRLSEVRSKLEAVAERLIQIPLPLRASRQDTEQIDSLLKNMLLGRSDRLLRGAGIAYAKDLFDDEELSISWWDLGRDSEHDFDGVEPSRISLQYYEHDRLPWFIDPLKHGNFCAYGPYIDRGGVEDLIVTVSIPVRAKQYRGSVIAADLRVDEIENVFFGVLPRASSRKFAVLNTENRVVVSTTELLSPGMLADDESLSQDLLSSAQDPDVAGVGWRLVAFHP